jgi:hypothetical protein
MPRAQRSGDHRTIALLAGKCCEMKIMRCGFCRTGQRSIPGHWWHHPVVNNWNIAFRNYSWHGVLLLGVLEPSCENGAGPRGDTGVAKKYLLQLVWQWPRF